MGRGHEAKAQSQPAHRITPPGRRPHFRQEKRKADPAAQLAKPEARFGHWEPQAAFAAAGEKSTWPDRAERGRRFTPEGDYTATGAVISRGEADP